MFKKINPLLKWSVISFIFVSLIMIGFFFYNRYEIKSLICEELQKNKDLINSINIKTEKGKLVLFVNNISENVEESQQIEFKDFMEKYYETQSNWLNFWLTILALFLGVLGIVIPICFIKFYEDKKEEINSLIKDMKDRKNEFNDFYIKKEQQLNILYATYKKAAKIEAKNQVDISKLISIMQSYIKDKRFDSALKIADSIIEKDKDNYYAYYTKAYALCHPNNKNKDFNSALKNINMAIRLNPNDDELKKLKALINLKLKNFEQALKIYENIEEKDFTALSDMIEAKIILNKIDEAKGDLNKLTDKIENNRNKIIYQILKMELDCIESSTPIDEKYIKENIFAIDSTKKINWSFEEIKCLLSNKSYLNQEQKTKLGNFISLIEQENKKRENLIEMLTQLAQIKNNKRETDRNNERW